MAEQVLVFTPRPAVAGGVDVVNDEKRGVISWSQMQAQIEQVDAASTLTGAHK